MKQAEKIVKGSCWITNSGNCARIDADDYPSEDSIVGRIYDCRLKSWLIAPSSWTSEGIYHNGPGSISLNSLAALWKGPLPWQEKEEKVESPNTTRIWQSKPEVKPRKLAYLKKFKSGAGRWAVRYYPADHMMLTNGDTFMRAPWLDEKETS
jgi:hypothetical protein